MHKYTVFQNPDIVPYMCLFFFLYLGKNNKMKNAHIYCINKVFGFDFLQKLNRLFLNANICVTSIAIQVCSPQNIAAQSSEILESMLIYKKNQRQRRHQRNHPTIQRNHPTMFEPSFFSACLFWLGNMKGLCVTKDTHVSYTSN